MKIESGSIIIAVLHTPREKLLGVLDEISAAGLSMRAVELGYFDDWCSSIADEEPYLPMTDYFIPMWRVERVSRDEGAGGGASMSEQFEQRTGRLLTEM